MGKDGNDNVLDFPLLLSKRMRDMVAELKATFGRQPTRQEVRRWNRIVADPLHKAGAEYLALKEEARRKGQPLPPAPDLEAMLDDLVVKFRGG